MEERQVDIEFDPGFGEDEKGLPRFRTSKPGIGFLVSGAGHTGYVDMVMQETGIQDEYLNYGR